MLIIKEASTELGRGFFYLWRRNPLTDHTLQHAPHGHQKRNGEIYHETMIEGYDHILLPTTLGDDGKRGIHGGGSTGRDRCQRTKETHQQG